LISFSDQQDNRADESEKTLWPFKFAATHNAAVDRGRFVKFANRSLIALALDQNLKRALKAR
jgi:hypothetical protein